MTPLRQRMIEDMQLRNLAAGNPKALHPSRRRLRQVLRQEPRTARPRGRPPVPTLPPQRAQALPRNHQPVYFRLEVSLPHHPGDALDRRVLSPHPPRLTNSRSCSARRKCCAFFDHIPSLKYRAALMICYGAGLRVTEAVALQISDIDSKRMLLRVEQGKGHKDRYAMLSPRLLEVLRRYYRAAPLRRPADYLFPSWRKEHHLCTTSLQLACREAALPRRHPQTRHRPHPSPLLCHSPAGERHRYSASFRCCSATASIDTTARYTAVSPQVVAATVSPLDQLDQTPPKPAASHQAHQKVSPQPTLELADIFRQYGPAYRQAHPIAPASASPDAGHRDLPHSGCWAVSSNGATTASTRTSHYRSCRNRHCPKCQGLARAKWLEQRRAELLPTEYFHVVFTLPRADRRHRLLQQRSRLRHSLPRHRRNPAHHCRRSRNIWARRLGFFAVLHTWGQNLHFHPHLHCVVPGGGLSADHERWIAGRRSFLLPVKVLSRLLPPSLSGSSGEGLHRRRTPVLRRSGTAARSQRFRPLPGSAARRQMGGLCQASLRRTAAGAGVPGPLYPSRGHLQPAPAGAGRRPSLLRWKDYRDGSKSKVHDRLRRGVHPPLPAALPAARLPAHPLLRLPGQLPSRQTGSLPPTPGYRCLPAATQFLTASSSCTHPPRPATLPPVRPGILNRKPTPWSHSAVWTPHDARRSQSTGSPALPPGSAPSLHAYPPCAGVAILFFRRLPVFYPSLLRSPAVTPDLPPSFHPPLSSRRTDAQSAIAQPNKTHSTGRSCSLRFSSLHGFINLRL